MIGIASFAHMMPDSVNYQAVSSRDSYGDITYAAATTYRARVVGEQKIVRSFAGTDVMSAHTVYLGAAINPQPEDKITLSTGIAGSTQATAISPPILGAKRVPDQSGVHHCVLYLG